LRMSVSTPYPTSVMFDIGTSFSTSQLHRDSLG
jgi:hypothetical protein